MSRATQSTGQNPTTATPFPKVKKACPACESLEGHAEGCVNERCPSCGAMLGAHNANCQRDAELAEAPSSESAVPETLRATIDGAEAIMLNGQTGGPVSMPLFKDTWLADAMSRLERARSILEQRTAEAKEASAAKKSAQDNLNEAVAEALMAHARQRQPSLFPVLSGSGARAGDAS